jgi:hypothetical protein
MCVFELETLTTSDDSRSLCDKSTAELSTDVLFQLIGSWQTVNLA